MHQHPARTPHRRRRSLPIATALLLAACTGGSARPPATTTTPRSPTTVVVPDDGQLVIGVLLPQTGPGTELGRAMRQAIDLAIGEINAAGGVNRANVRIVSADEGADAAAARLGLGELLAANVDAIVGPASSRIALAVLASTTGAGKLTCSPTASALALDSFPDDGLFVRTIPSDSMQAAAMAQLIEQSGRGSAAITYVDDDYGRPFAEALSAALAARTIRVTATVPYRATDTDLRDELRALEEAESGVVAIIADADGGPRLVNEFLQATQADGTLVIGNDVLRTAAASFKFAGLAPGQRSRISGVAPAALPQSQSFLNSFREFGPAPAVYATNAYDCVNLIALAAADVGTRSPSALAESIGSISRSGTSCSNFATCIEPLLEERNIDYDGPTGQLDLGVSGEPSQGLFDVYRLDPQGTDETTSRLLVTG